MGRQCVRECGGSRGWRGAAGPPSGGAGGGARRTRARCAAPKGVRAESFAGSFEQGPRCLLCLCRRSRGAVWGCADVAGFVRELLALGELCGRGPVEPMRAAVRRGRNGAGRGSAGSSANSKGVLGG